MLSKLTFLIAALFFIVSCENDAEVDTTTANSIINNSNLSLEELTVLNANNQGSSCTNVVIANGFAYAACDNIILIANLKTGDVNSMTSAADDITVDEGLGLLFTQAGTTVRMFDLSNPSAPDQVASASVNFGLFSGVSAAGCALVVSGGVGGSDTRVFRYSADNFDLVLTENGIPAADNTTGTPDVHVARTGQGVMAFYSQDIGSVANWAIQPALFNGVAELQSTPPRIVLTPGSFPGPFGAPFGPANFPVESEYLDGNLYVAHFAVPGIEVIDIANGSLLSPFDLPYQPTNIGTDGELLFVVGVNNDTVDIIDPDNGAILESLGNLITPSGVAASETHIAVADQSLGLVIIAR